MISVCLTQYQETMLISNYNSIVLATQGTFELSVSTTTITYDVTSKQHLILLSLYLIATNYEYNRVKQVLFLIN